jgi:hypothetical protein
MKRVLLSLFALMLCIVVCAHAQWPEENHYKVYNIDPGFDYHGNIQLLDQFGSYSVESLWLQKFANPVHKNQEPIFFPEVHHTWWMLDLMGVGWRVDLFNQFGPQVWQVENPRYLVAPARKYETGPPLPFNHYLAYEAFGVPLQMPVFLQDQFGDVEVVVMEPLYFLNPVEKTHDGLVYPIIDPMSHLACYRIDPPLPYDIQVVAEDQFGMHDFMIMDHDCLCVPSWKENVVKTENKTWSDIKELYRD